MADTRPADTRTEAAVADNTLAAGDSLADMVVVAAAGRRRADSSLAVVVVVAVVGHHHSKGQRLGGWEQGRREVDL